MTFLLQHPLYSYKVKIINPKRKSDVMLRQLHNFHDKFESMVGLRASLIEEFSEKIPESLTFNVGYFEGQGHRKISLVSIDDLKAMYASCPGGAVTLWCDSKGEDEDDGSNKRIKRKKDESSTRRQEKECEVDEVFETLVSRHSDRYNRPQLRLWARMVCSNIHEDLDNPPNIPAFSGKTNRKSQPESISDAIGGAAVAIVKALKSDVEPRSAVSHSVPVTSRVSPAKSVELRMKSYEQLRYLSKLFDDGIITDTEFADQKSAIMMALKKL